MQVTVSIIVSAYFLGATTAFLASASSASDGLSLIADTDGLVLVQGSRFTAAEAASRISGVPVGSPVGGGKGDQIATLRAPRINRIDDNEAAYIDDAINSQIDLVYFLYPDGPEPIFSVVERDCEGGWQRSSAVCIMSVLQQAIAIQVFP